MLKNLTFWVLFLLSFQIEDCVDKKNIWKSYKQGNIFKDTIDLNDIRYRKSDEIVLGGFENSCFYNSDSA